MRDLMNLVDGVRFKTKEPDAGWRERLGERGMTIDTQHPESIAEEIKAKLFALGGWAAIVHTDDSDLPKIIARGEVWDGKTATFVKGQPINCHGNTATLYKEANLSGFEIVNGFAMSEDGCWRPHSWGLMNGKPVETTVKRVAYVGFVMNPAEAEDFCRYNYR